MYIVAVFLLPVWRFGVLIVVVTRNEKLNDPLGLGELCNSYSTVPRDLWQ